MKILKIRSNIHWKYKILYSYQRNVSKKKKSLNLESFGFKLQLQQQLTSGGLLETEICCYKGFRIPGCDLYK